jgi:hypothetical protein
MLRTLPVVAAALVLSACAPKVHIPAQSQLPTSATSPPTTTDPAARIAFFDKPDTSFANLPTRMDTGQPIAYSTPMPQGQPFIAKGGLTIPGGAVNGPVASYQIFDAGQGNYLDRIGMLFRWDGTGRTTADTVMGLAITTDPGLDIADPSYRMAVHFNLTAKTWALQKVNVVNGSLEFTTIARGQLKKPLTPGNDSYSVELWRVGNTCTIALPDGQVVTGTDPDIDNWAGRYGFFEPYLTHPATDALPYITEAWYDINAVQPPQT